MDRGDERFQWGSLVALFIHPLKVAIIEALLRVERPLSPALITRLLDDEFHLSLIDYHLSKLAEAGIVELVGTRRVRGAKEHFYFFASRNGATPEQAP